MIRFIPSICLLLCFGSEMTAQSAQINILSGRLIDVSHQPPVPVAKATVTIRETQQSEVTNASGLFQFSLPPGRKEVEIEVSGNLRLYRPMDGRMNAQTPGAAKPDDIQLLPAGHPSLLHGPGATEAIADKVSKSAFNRELTGSSTISRSGPKERLRQWAADNGISFEEVERSMNAWADQVRADPRANVRNQANAAFQRQNYAAAAALFAKLATAEATQFGRLDADPRRRETEARMVLRRFLDDKIREAECFQQELKSEEAARTLDVAARLVNHDRYPDLWAEMKVRLGSRLLDIASSGEATLSIDSLHAALLAFQGALTVYKAFPLERAGTLNNLGLTYQLLGERVSGREAVKNLQAAIAAYRDVLSDIAGKESLRPVWAMVQNNLGNAYATLGEQLDGAEALTNLQASVDAYSEALSIRTKVSQPEAWATTKINLGVARDRIGERLSGGEGEENFRAAINACRDALQVYKKDTSPKSWALAQTCMGNGYDSLGGRLAGPEGMQALQAAIDAYQSVLLVQTKKSLPQVWATIQNNLGNVHAKIAQRLSKDERMARLQDAVTAYQYALEVRTFESLPQDWAMTWNNLGNSYQRLAEQLPAAEAMVKLNAAISAYQSALRVYTKESFPKVWADVQNNMGFACQNLASRLGGTGGAERLRDAVNAYHNALLIRTKESLPHQWAMTQSNLAAAYFMQRNWENAAQAVEDFLSLYPTDVRGLAFAEGIYQEHLYRFDRAFELNARRVELGEGKLDFVEKHLTTARFGECITRAAETRTTTSEKSERVLLTIYRYACLVGEQKLREARELGRELGKEISDLERSNWTFAGVKHFVSESPLFASNSTEWVRLFDALENGDRENARASLVALDTGGQ